MIPRAPKIPELPEAADRALRAALDSIIAEVRRVGAPPPVSGLKHRGHFATEGGVVRVRGGQRVALPRARTENAGDAIVVIVEVAGAISITAHQGKVNGARVQTLSDVGAYTFYSNGVDGWYLQGSLPGTSSGGAALDAEYLLGAAHASLPSGRVATDSTEIDAELTVANVVSWALRTASVGFSKLADLTGLSVLGRAANSTGVMAAITASAARQTLRANDAGTALEWGHPVEARDSGVDQGDAFALDFVAGTGINIAASVAGGVATITPSLSVVPTATTGAVTIAAGGGSSTFSGIRDNGTLETARTHLNFVSTTLDTTFSVTQDAGNDELEVRVSTLGSFYSENAVGSFQTKFLSFDDGDLLEARVTDNTGGSGFVNITFDLNLSANTSIANIGEGPNATGEARVSRDDMYRWLDSQSNVRVFEEEFLGNLAACTARFTVVSGFAGFPTLSAVNVGEFNGAVNLQNTSPAGTTRGVWTLGANESALNFNWDSLRYLCVVFRTGSATVVADTQFALGLVGPFTAYGAVTASTLGSTSEGMFIEYITTLSGGDFRVGYRKSSTTAVTDTAVPVVANTRYVFEIFRTSDGADFYYLDGVLMRSDAAGIGPTGSACTFFATILGSTTATRNFQIDSIKVVSQSTNRFG